ncbi:heavy metal translocating P-type ATPase [Steroidobacter agaridevorans]|uniref:heavy metal translocating P-type ATPase n=1 Tax=Steroidobacter agaridevorans TaxID=2695856 RepID=UPI00132718D4|nr:heavy metal translocating P-type ATPase [Steroidobacter agaridevorans]GFE91660.1 copper-translocating P-type ATPase [Steroidobacter agaridevorans]
MNVCFHCGEPLRGSTLVARVEQRDEPVCCSGCQAVAELIAGTGLGDFYRYRDGSSVRPGDGSQSDKWRVYADPQFAAQFTRTSKEQTSVTLLIEGLRCSACSWLIDQVLRRLGGVHDVSVNAATGRASVIWNNAQLNLADIMRTIAQLGYVPHPVTDETVTQALREERRDSLKRLAVAGFGMMQVMMFAVAVYSAELANEIMEPRLLSYFRMVSLLVATPVMFYAGAPILSSAWNSVRSRSIGMDVPVSIALVLAYGASVWNTFSGAGGEVYFDSVTMFIFFLTLGRFVQMSVRQHTAGVTDALARQLPSIAHRVGANGIEDVPVTSLLLGGVIQVRRGEVLPADGKLLDADAHIDEAMLTGESLPVHRKIGQRVVAGTINVDGPISIAITALGTDTALSHIVALMQRAQTYKPALARNADSAAARFLGYVLIGAGLTCAAWLAIDPSQAFAATLAVLVVACPCAFAIATPAALASATATLGRHGILLTDPDALESLAKVDHIVFDKTGTLTQGELRISRCIALAGLSEQQCLHTAALLEQASEHPLARAFAPYLDQGTVEDMQTIAGRGVQGRIGGRLYRIGSPDFVAELCREQQQPTALTGSVIMLADEQRALAWFELTDSLRPAAASAVSQLRSLNIEPQILSGDGSEAVQSIARQCGITEQFARHSAKQKLTHVLNLQKQGRRVAVIGDGVNDAPVLGAADVSIAMGRGSALAHASAGLVLVSDNLAALPEAVLLARRTLRIAKQNLLWAAIYNLGSIPLAALGFIPPWLAALGMSLSSVAVMLNSTRLLPRGARHTAASPVVTSAHLRETTA